MSVFITGSDTVNGPIKSYREVVINRLYVFKNIRITIGTISGDILIYDIKSRNIKKRFPRAPSSVFNFKWNSSDSHIAAACINGDIIVFNNTSSNISCIYNVPNSGTVSAINFHGTRKNLLGAGSEEGVVAVWDITRNKILSDLRAHKGPVTGVMFSPLRSDLLISSGLDRRLDFYDIDLKKNLIQIELQHCATSLDVSPCGMYLAVGSQTGNIVLYDTRNCAQPIIAFPAHKQKIRQLCFQKSLSNNDIKNISIVSIPEDLPRNTEKVESFTDSMGLISCDYALKDTECDSSKTKAQDSFLTALGIDSSVNVSEPSIKYEEFRCVASTRNEQSRPDKEISASLHNPASALKSCLKQVSSTPKHVIENLPSVTESPIVSEGLTNPTIHEFKEAIKEVIQSELQPKFAKLESDFKFELLEAIHDIRRQILALQMIRVKESLLIENKLNSFDMILKRIESLQQKQNNLNKIY
ncbi:hypothetical protein FQR65_LT01094 [Abscondita terminalis]|nr:hypothetical protein FQR65_LT01094 [Abscondita terminalis]